MSLQKDEQSETSKTKGGSAPCRQPQSPHQSPHLIAGIFIKIGSLAHIVNLWKQESRHTLKSSKEMNINQGGRRSTGTACVGPATHPFGQAQASPPGLTARPPPAHLRGHHERLVLALQRHIPGCCRTRDTGQGVEESIHMGCGQPGRHVAGCYRSVWQVNTIFLFQSFVDINQLAAGTNTKHRGG